MRYSLNGDAGDYLCRPAAFGVGDGFVAFDVYWGSGPDLMPAEDRIYYAALDEIAHVPDPVRTLTVGGPVAIERVEASSRGVAWEIGPAAHTQAMIDGGFVDLGYGAHSPELVGAHVLSTDWEGPIRLWAADGTPTVLIDLTPQFTWHAVTDGTDVAWVQLDPAAASWGTLFTAPHTVDGASFVARRVEDHVDPRDVRVGDGLVAFNEIRGEPAQHVGWRVVDLATGEARVFLTPPGEGASWLYLVSATELIFETRRLVEPSGGYLYVVDPASLPLAP